MKQLRRIILLIALLLLAACAPQHARNPVRDGALLRLEYREHAPTLPHLRLDGVQLQESSRLGRGSSVVWRFQEKELGEDWYLPIPDSYEMQDRMHQSLSSTFETFGFALRGWPGDPQPFVGVKVNSMRLRSLGVGDGYRSCDLELEFIVREAPSGVEITRFITNGQSRFSGSWTHMYRSGPRWLPEKDQPHPVLEATRVAALDFLAESLNFWRDPAKWEASISFSNATP
jgi:hypothetical protein